MKKIIISSLILLFVSSFGFAQGKFGLTGPKAKNYKPFRNNTPTQGLEIASKPKIMGPKAKNAKPWEQKEDLIVVYNLQESDRPKLMGPKAKNYKPWRD